MLEVQCKSDVEVSICAENSDARGVLCCCCLILCCCCSACYVYKITTLLLVDIFTHLVGLVVKASPGERKLRGSNPACVQAIFPGRVIPVT